MLYLSHIVFWKSIPSTNMKAYHLASGVWLLPESSSQNDIVIRKFVDSILFLYSWHILRKRMVGDYQRPVSLSPSRPIKTVWATFRGFGDEFWLW